MPAEAINEALLLTTSQMYLNELLENTLMYSTTRIGENPCTKVTKYN